MPRYQLRGNDLGGYRGGATGCRARDHRYRRSRRRSGGLCKRAALAFVRRWLGVGGLAAGATAGVMCLAALGEDLRLLDPVLLVDAAFLAERLLDAFDIAAHPGRDLLVARDAELAECGCRGRIDGANAA